MLVLTRFKDEDIMIGDDIRITVLGTQGGKVSIGIDAPGRCPSTARRFTKRSSEGNPSPNGLTRTTRDAIMVCRKEQEHTP